MVVCPLSSHFMDLFSDLQAVPQMRMTYFIKLRFFIREFFNGITEIYFYLHICHCIHIAVINRDTKFVVLHCCTIDCINRIF
jgi:hypothetical protein